MEELLLKLIEEVRKTYKDKKAADLVFKRLFAAAKGSSDYTEAYEFAKRAGHDLEDAIIENWAALMQDSEVFASTAKQLLKGVVPDMNEDILKACEQIQDNKNAAAGMRIKPQTAVADPYDLNRIAEGLDGKKMSALDGVLATHACKTVDSTERANMDFAMGTGYEIKVKRTYDGVGLRRKTKHAEKCSYCLERAGTRTFDNTRAVNSSGIFARHEGCGCTIDYENQRTGTKSKDVQNFYTGKKKKTTKLQGNAENVEANLEKARKDDIIKLEKRFSSQEDPMEEVTGDAFVSNPEEMRTIMNSLKEWGVDTNASKNIGYGAASFGSPGNISYQKGMSYSAWMHEFQHVLDAKDNGWDAVKVLLYDKEERKRREIKAYGVEIALAEKANRPDIVERLRRNLERELREIDQN